MGPEPTDNALIGTAEAAAKIGIRPQRLRVMRMTGGGPAFLKIGNSVRYRLYDLETWLASCRVRNTTEARALAQAQGGAA